MYLLEIHRSYLLLFYINMYCIFVLYVLLLLLSGISAQTSLQSPHVHLDATGTIWKPSLISVFISILDYNICHQFPDQLYHVDRLVLLVDNVSYSILICNNHESRYICMQQILETGCLSGTYVKLPFPWYNTTNVKLAVYKSEQVLFATLRV